MAENSEKTNILEAKDYYDKGILCFKSSNYNEAIENFSSCIAVDPTWPDAWEALADSYFELRNYKAAFEISVMAEQKNSGKPSRREAAGTKTLVYRKFSVLMAGWNCLHTVLKTVFWHTGIA